MNTLPTSSYKYYQKLHPLSLLAQLTSRRVNGCLQVFNGSASWSIYLEDGKLIYASYSVDPQERLTRHWHALNLHQDIASVQALFMGGGNQPNIADYQAICALVNQGQIDGDQAAKLIEEMAKEVLQAFLQLKEGSYEFSQAQTLSELPKFCHLDLRSLVEHCQKQQSANRRESATQIANPISEEISQNKSQEATIKVALQSETTANISSTDNSHIPVKDSQSRTSKNLYTIVCIDDSPTVLKSIKSFLDDKTFSVIMISDPVKALMQILRCKPDLILLDVEMPNLDGYELCSLLRRHSAFKNIPIVMVTGRSGFVDRAKAKLVRSSGYLTKPFTQSDLLKIVFKNIN